MTRSRRPCRESQRRYRLVVVAASWLLVVLVAGCSAAPPISPPAGVDGLTIPTPSPDPSDFTDRVDNPWFPLEMGSVWRYRLEEGGSASSEVVEGIQIGGVPTVGLLFSTIGEGVRADVLDYYAQDKDGNVWWFGREGQWRAGDSGAQAGVVMTASPRVGDGYREVLAPGVTQSRAEVLAVDGQIEAQADSYVGVVRTQRQDELSPGRQITSDYAPGVGLVRAQIVDLEDESTVELVEFTPCSD